MSDACFHTEDVTCPNCALERDPDMSALAGLGRTIARQARAIRRLRTLADGYRWQRNLTRALRSHDERVAAEQERVRIVVALRKRASELDLMGYTVAAGEFRWQADAIERGEL